MEKAHSSPMLRQNSSHRIGILIFDQCQIVDATGCAGVFGSTNVIVSNMNDGDAYDVRFISIKAGAVRTSAGVALYADHALDEQDLCFDTLICSGGKGTFAFCEDAAALQRVKDLAGKATRRVSVCTGAFILAAAGLLNGRRAVTHWAYCKRLAAAYPEIDVDPDPIYIRDGDVFTSAGVTSGMDLALSLVEMDHGRDISLRTARDMVMYLQRPGSQAQFSAHLAAQSTEHSAIRDLQLWLLDHLDEEHSIDDLADRTAMSPRTFYRQFKEATGMTPARFIAASRLDSARRLLEESPLALKVIAGRCGFSDAERMRRNFHRHYGVSPDDYRRRFASPNL